ncbi:hypothetical protein [Actinomadura rugatobispora]|uniref:TPR repeat domain-containing protein n=1 Tax=Actinomadura rugatobispora TaxID=1994 RepID=A0ABW1A3P3_9ACTN|nr:hypothetical protein GCM10010200_017940 [Actinomadura rugatobispora]
MAGFDPQDTDADPDQIDLSVEAFYDVAGRITGRSGELEGAFNGAAMNFSDLIAHDIWKQNEYNAEDWRSAVEAAVYGAGVTRAWAGDVREFKSRRRELIGRWETARGDDFGVVKQEPHPNLDRVELLVDPLAVERRLSEDFVRRRAAAEASLLRGLSGQAQTAWDALQEKAELRGRQLAQGPTPQNLRHLVRHGVLGWAPYNIRGADAPLPLNPEMAGLDAQALRDYLNGDLEPDAGYAAIIAALNAAVRQGIGRAGDGERVDPEVIEYLESFYGELGGDLMVMDAYANDDMGLGDRALLQGDTLRALGGGLLVLSNGRLGGGFDRLPQAVRGLFNGDFVNDAPAQTPTDAWGRDYAALADLLGHADRRLTPGTDFAVNLIAVTPHYLEVIASHPNQMASEEFRLLDGSARTMLRVATRDIEANHAILTGDFEPGEVGSATPELLRSLFTHDWADDGAMAARLTDWIYEDGVDERLAGEATAALINTVTGIGDGGLYAALTDTNAGLDSMGMINPELSRGLGNIAVAYLDDFAALQDDAETTSFAGGDLEVAYDARARFFELVAGDAGAATHLSAAVETFEHNNLLAYAGVPRENAASEFGAANARLRAYLDAGLLNEAMDRTGNAHDAAADAAFRELNGQTLVSGVLKETIGNFGPWSALGKAVIGVSNEAYRFDARAGSSVPDVVLQLPNAERQYSRTDLSQQTMLSLVHAAVRDGRIPMDEVPQVLRTGEERSPIRRLDEVPGSERDQAEDAARRLLEQPFPGFRDLLEVQEREYADVFSTHAASSPDHYKLYVRNGETSEYWRRWF